VKPKNELLLAANIAAETIGGTLGNSRKTIEGNAQSPKMSEKLVSFFCVNTLHLQECRSVKFHVELFVSRHQVSPPRFFWIPDGSCAISRISIREFAPLVHSGARRSAKESGG
jgi:hypothetical protein